VAGSRRPILFAVLSQNQTLPLLSNAGWYGPLSGVGTGNSVISPLAVIRAILLPVISANQTLPSGPVAMPRGQEVSLPSLLTDVGILNSPLNSPLVLTRRIVLSLGELNQRLPSPPTVMLWSSRTLAPGTLNSVILPSGVMRKM